MDLTQAANMTKGALRVSQGNFEDSYHNNTCAAHPPHLKSRQRLHQSDPVNTASELGPRVVLICLFWFIKLIRLEALTIYVGFSV